jgi:hypothetical protein
MHDDFTYQVIGQAWDIHDDNIDIEISLPDGRRYSATFFTLSNIESLFEKNRRTGECDSGLYLWASDMVIVRDLEQQTIERTIASLIEQDELSSACHRIN